MQFIEVKREELKMIRLLLLIVINSILFSSISHKKSSFRCCISKLVSLEEKKSVKIAEHFNFLVCKVSSFGRSFDNFSWPILSSSISHFNHFIDELNTYILTYLEFLESTKNSAGKNAVITPF